MFLYATNAFVAWEDYVAVWSCVHKNELWNSSMATKWRGGKVSKFEAHFELEAPGLIALLTPCPNWLSWWYQYKPYIHFLDVLIQKMPSLEAVWHLFWQSKLGDLWEEHRRLMPSKLEQIPEFNYALCGEALFACHQCFNICWTNSSVLRGEKLFSTRFLHAMHNLYPLLSTCLLPFLEFPT